MFCNGSGQILDYSEAARATNGGRPKSVRCPGCQQCRPAKPSRN